MNADLRRLPGLDNLKGFAVAARHLSFTRAAAELFLTQSAVSRQIQTLEAQLSLLVGTPPSDSSSAENSRAQD